MRTGILLGTILLLILSSSVYAESVKVKINNDVNTSTESEVNSSSHSRVEITTNGEKKVFESNGESINYESPDGKTNVRINTDNRTSKNTTQRAVDTVKEEVRGAVDQGKKQVNNKANEARKVAESKAKEELDNQSFGGLFEQIKNFIMNLFDF